MAEVRVERGSRILEGMPTVYVYWKGDRAEYTGEQLWIAGGLFYELRLMDGHRIGEHVWRSKPPSQ